MWSLWRFWKVSQDIERNRFIPHYRAVFAIGLGLLFAGGLSAVWLFTH